jgi:hypothetical protein
MRESPKRFNHIGKLGREPGFVHGESRRPASRLRLPGPADPRADAVIDHFDALFAAVQGLLAVKVC